ncbi:hypothetical protein FRB91_007401 [Serendipita sp. 411]|nr:hypothetical protein FRB91_007401 [Serendipita sp. 411]
MQRISIVRNRMFLTESYLYPTRAMKTASMASTSFLLTPAQASTLPSSSTKFLDTTWLMPNSPRSARQEFEKARIRGAKYFDLDEVAGPNELGLKAMMPSSEQFKEACDQLGITKEDSVVLSVRPSTDSHDSNQRRLTAELIPFNLVSRTMWLDTTPAEC